MPRSPRRARLLAVAAVTSMASLGVAGLAGCSRGTGGPDLVPRQTAHAPVEYHVAPGPQPVRGPAHSGLDLGSPVRPRPFHSPSARPNLLMITVDDAARGDMQYMPHLKQLLADRGVTLTNGIAPTPMCVPARASLLTGQYAHNHGALTIHGIGGGFATFDDANTLPVWLQRRGYDTLFIGKYLNGYGEDGSGQYVPPGWSQWHATVDPTTYAFTNETVNDNGTLRDYPTYSTSLLRDYCLSELSSPRRQQHPWFMWVNYVAPHVGGGVEPGDPAATHPDDPHPVKTTTPDRRDAGTFDWLQLPQKPDMFENPSDKVVVGRTHTRWPPDRRAELRTAHQERVEALQAVDRSLARTVATLRRTHQLDDTYIVFTSDNGYALGEHNLAGKLYYFREITGIPMYVRGPGLPRGYTSDTPVTNADWAPTLAALAGATPTRAVDGVDVLPWLTRDASTRVVPIEAWPVFGGTRPLYRGVEVGPWTWVRGRNGKVELYDRRVDPWQDHNLARDPRFRRQRTQLARLARKYDECAGRSCPRTFYR